MSVSTCSSPYRKVSAAACCYNWLTNQSQGNNSFQIPYLLEFCCFSPFASAHEIPRLIPHSKQFGKQNPSTPQTDVVSQHRRLSSLGFGWRCSTAWGAEGKEGEVWRICRRS